MMCTVTAVDDEVESESSGGQRLNDSQRATSLAGRTAHEAEEMLKIMEIKHKYKLVVFLSRRYFIEISELIDQLNFYTLCIYMRLILNGVCHCFRPIFLQFTS